MRSTLRVTKAVADVQRVRILLMLQEGELCVCQIVEVLALAASTVSKHLSILDAAGLVQMRKEGRWAYYRLPEGEMGEAGPVLEWLSQTLRGDETVARDRENLREVLALDRCAVAQNQRTR